MITAIISGLGKATLSLLATLMTEALFKRVIARIVVSALEKLIKSTKTKLDDQAVQPFIDKLKEEY